MVNAQILSITQGKGLGLGLGKCSDLIYHSGENTERARLGLGGCPKTRLATSQTAALQPLVYI